MRQLFSLKLQQTKEESGESLAAKPPADACWVFSVRRHFASNNARFCATCFKNSLKIIEK